MQQFVTKKVSKNYRMKNLTIVLLTAFCAQLAYSQTDSAAFYYQKGIEEKTARRYREAEKNFLKAGEYNPNDLNSILELAQTYNAQNKYGQAREKFLAAEKLDANNPLVIENLATLSFNLRKWDDAIKYAQKMQQLKINKPANYIIGKSYYEQENYGEAIKFLDLAAKEEPTRADIFYIIGRSYLDMTNNKPAAANFEKAIALDTTRANWIYELGLIYSVVPDYKKSLYYIELAGNKGYTKSNDYLENLGSAYINAGQIEKGIEMYKEVLKRKPTDMEMLYQVAQAYYKVGKYQEAIDYWDQVFGLDKTNAKALYMIGLSYQKRGEKEKGMQICDKAIEIDPSLNSLKQKKDGGLGL